jgi:hypothetical protein
MLANVARRSLAPALIAVLIVMPRAAARGVVDTPPEGTWAGTYATSESGGELTIRITAAGDEGKVEVRATSEYVANPQFLMAAEPRISGDTVSFMLHWGTPVRWTGVVHGDTLSGRMQADHWAGTWTTIRQKSGNGSR